MGKDMVRCPGGAEIADRSTVMLAAMTADFADYRCLGSLLPTHSGECGQWIAQAK
jgi:hypothetical protein